jgi:hypothetical protein
MPLRQQSEARVVLEDSNAFAMVDFSIAPEPQLRLVTRALTPDEARELNELFDALPVALELARKLLPEESPVSAAYMAADAEFARIIGRINALLNG